MIKKDEMVTVIKFALLCLPNAVAEAALYAGLLWIACPHPAAQAISYAVGAVICYALNRKYTFKTKGKFLSAEMLKFFTVSIVSLLLGVGIMWAEVQWIGLSGTPLKDTVAKGVVMFLTTVSNYIGDRLWSFRNDGADS